MEQLVSAASYYVKISEQLASVSLKLYGHAHLFAMCIITACLLQVTACEILLMRTTCLV